jgi:cytochrome c peroxidase
MTIRIVLACAVLLAMMALASWFGAFSSPKPLSMPATRWGMQSLGMPALPALTTAASPQQIELGRKLFFDRRLSINGTMSCAMCHVPEEGFTSNASKLSIGLEGVSLRRNAPSVLNVAWQTKLFHDGREPSLSSVPWSALLHADEMGNPSPDHLLARLRTWPDYAGRFEQAFGGAAASKNTLGEAVAAYLRTLVAGDSRFDQWRYANRTEALTSLEQRGFSVFTGAGRCTACHAINDQSALFADGRFHVTGAGFKPQATSISVELAAGVHTTLKPSDLAAFADPRRPDLGRFDISQQAQDRFAFKTPSLRNVSRTAPYMHDGSLASLEEVVAFYNQGGDDAPGKSPLLKPLNLTAEDQRALVAFLKSLDSQNLPSLISSARAPG